MGEFDKICYVDLFEWIDKYWMNRWIFNENMNIQWKDRYWMERWILNE